MTPQTGTSDTTGLWLIATVATATLAAIGVLLILMGAAALAAHRERTREISVTRIFEDRQPTAHTKRVHNSPADPTEAKLINEIDQLIEERKATRAPTPIRPPGPRIH